MGEKCALVTGAGRGIGRAIALALAADGYAVVINYARDKAAAEATLAAVQGAGGAGRRAQADISQAADRDRLVAITLQQYGRIALLVNNAGVAPKERRDILAATEESFDAVLATNLKGPYFLTQKVANTMIKAVQESGSPRSTGRYQPKIVNITSVSAYAVSLNRGEYCISKAGAAMMTRLFAVRLAEYGIGVYELRPGIIATDMTAAVKEKYDAMFAQGLTPITRWGTPEDVASAVRGIAAGLFPYSTGEVINVDGGFHLRSM